MDLVRARKKCDSVPLQCAYTCLSPNFFSSVPSLPRHEPIIVISSILKEFDSIPGITEVFSSRSIPLSQRNLMSRGYLFSTSTLAYPFNMMFYCFTITQMTNEFQHPFQ